MEETAVNNRPSIRTKPARTGEQTQNSFEGTASPIQG
ncbi:hypothetical protein ABIB90_001988 [Bradyrhizobium sp. JR4.1]